MEVVRSISQLQQKLGRIRAQSVGMIQTKGALHKGHISLIKAARKENEIVVVVSLLHPFEFSTLEDYQGYPRTPEEDQELASISGADFLFCPLPNEIYNEEDGMLLSLKTSLGEVLNGQYVLYANKLILMMCLLNIIKPQNSYISDKDLQWVKLTKRFIEAFHYSCRLKVLPKLRDAEDMLMTARNRDIKADEKKQVAQIYKILQKAQRAYEKGMTSSRKMKWHIENDINTLYLCQLEVVEVIEPERLTPVEMILEDAIVLVTVKVGKLRISDYILLKKE